MILKPLVFVSTRNALESHKNILWIVGGMHKLNDNFDLKGVRHNIIRAYIIGKNVKFFVKQIQKKIDYIISGNLDTALKNMFNDLNKNNYPKKLVVLFSPSSASYDQFSNFAQRGNKFKFLVKKYAKKYL